MRPRSVNVRGPRMNACGGVDERRVGIVAFVDKTVVAVLLERGGDSLGRFVDPHEEMGSDDERQVQEDGLHDLEGASPLILRIEPLAGADRAGQAAVQRGEAPFGDHERTRRLPVRMSETLFESFDDAAIQVQARVDVDRDDIAVPAGDVPDARSVEREPATQDQVVRVRLAQGRARDAEIAFGRGADERLPVAQRGGGVRGRRRPGDGLGKRDELRVPRRVERRRIGITFLDQCEQGGARRRFRGQLPDGIGQAGRTMSLAEPFQFVVQEIAEKP